MAGAQDELDGIARLVRAFTQTPEPGAADARPVRAGSGRRAAAAAPDCGRYEA